MYFITSMRIFLSIYEQFDWSIGVYYCTVVFLQYYECVLVMPYIQCCGGSGLVHETSQPFTGLSLWCPPSFTLCTCVYKKNLSFALQYSFMRVESEQWRSQGRWVGFGGSSLPPFPVVLCYLWHYAKLPSWLKIMIFNNIMIFNTATCICTKGQSSINKIIGQYFWRKIFLHTLWNYSPPPLPTIFATPLANHG